MLVITRGYNHYNPIIIPLNHHFPMVFPSTIYNTYQNTCVYIYIYIYYHDFIYISLRYTYISHPLIVHFRFVPAALALTWPRQTAPRPDSQLQGLWWWATAIPDLGGIPTLGKPWYNHRKTIQKWWFIGIYWVNLWLIYG